MKTISGTNKQAGWKSRVILIRDKDLLTDFNKPKPDRILTMIDQAVVALTGKGDPLEAWKEIVKPDDILGIKTNVWNYLPTPPELEQAIKTRAMEAGVRDENIGIKDRGLTREPLFQEATALINTRPLRTHAWSGVGSLIKNYIMFIDNPASLHGDSCADLASLWKLPEVEGKTRLNVLVMLNPLFHGVGRHHFSKEYTWEYCGLLVGFDPVAVDSVGIRILQAKRKEFFGEDRPLNPPAKHVFLADTRHKLGTADPEKIELIKLGWMEKSLI
ncbi:MAG TPA: DUF362 domain-containing protein [Bacteroidetes bacterium]|nr:DUF362 domain-containing protein [Bacteroidota bacterium]